MLKTQVTRIVCVLSFAVALALGVTASAQDRAPAQPKAPAPISGELVNVDAAAKMITVKTQAGVEEKFGYDDATEITGAKGASGLATLKDGRVTVHFKEDAQTKAKLATRIIVDAPKQ